MTFPEFVTLMALVICAVVGWRADDEWRARFLDDDDQHKDF